jgi:hypothetical protein
MNNETKKNYYFSQWIRLPFTESCTATDSLLLTMGLTDLFRFRFVSAYNSFHHYISNLHRQKVLSTDFLSRNKSITFRTYVQRGRS